MIKIEDYDYIQSSELLYQVRSAEVLWADYSRLLGGQNSAPHTCAKLDQFDKKRIDRWLVESAGLLSSSQCQPNLVNQRVEITSNVRLAYRPVRYGRSAIVRTQNGLSSRWPLLDIKGCGVASNMLPVPTYHGTGVVGMGRAFRELFLAQAVAIVLKRLASAVMPVEIIAVLSLGVPVQLVDGTDIACVLVREPHIRPQGNRELPDRFSPEMKIKVALEALFMTLGFSTAWKFMELAFENRQFTNTLDIGGSHPELRPELVKLLLDTFADGCFYEFGLANTQICRAISLSPLTAKIIDLEHFFFRERFGMDIWFPADNEPLNWGFYISQSDPLFMQPAPELLERMRPLRNVLGRNVPFEQAAFAQGVGFANELNSGVPTGHVSNAVNALLRDLEFALPADAFDDPVDVNGKRISPRKLGEWSLAWADQIMSDTAVPFLTRNTPSRDFTKATRK